MPPPAIGTSLRSMQFDLRTRTHSFFRWPLQTRNWRNGAGPGLRSSNIPPRPEEMIAGQVTDGVRRIELTSGYDCGNYKLPSQYGAHLYPALARLPGHSHGAWSRGSLPSISWPRQRSSRSFTRDKFLRDSRP